MVQHNHDEFHESHQYFNRPFVRSIIYVALFTAFSFFADHVIKASRFNARQPEEYISRAVVESNELRQHPNDLRWDEWRYHLKLRGKEGEYIAKSSQARNLQQGDCVNVVAKRIFPPEKNKYTVKSIEEL